MPHYTDINLYLLACMMEKVFVTFTHNYTWKLPSTSLAAEWLLRFHFSHPGFFRHGVPIGKL